MVMISMDAGIKCSFQIRRSVTTNTLADVLWYTIILKMYYYTEESSHVGYYPCELTNITDILKGRCAFVFRV